MNKERESSFGIKKIANFVDVGKVSKFLFNENVGIIMLMSLAAICHGLKDKHLIFANGRIFMVFASFLYLVVVQGSDVVSRWSRSDTKKGFLTVRNMIELGFLVVLLVAGIVTILTIFKGREDLTYNFLGVFGVIWILQCIQRLKNFSSTRDNVHKLIGPFIAIIILIFGCAMHHFLEGTVVGQFAGPVSFVLAPATMWISSLIFGDINGRSDGEDDTIHPLVGCAMAILLGFVVYAVFINPEVYGIEMTTMDAKTINDILKEAKKDRRDAFTEIEIAESNIRTFRGLETKLHQEIQDLTQQEGELQKGIESADALLPGHEHRVRCAEQELITSKKLLDVKEKEFEPHKSHIEPLETQIRDIQTDIRTKGEEIDRMVNKQGILRTNPTVEKLQKEINDMNQNSDRIAADIGTYKAQNKIDDLQKTIKEIKESITTTEERIEDASGTVKKLHEEMVEKKAKLGDLGTTKDARNKELEELQKRILDKEKALAKLKQSPHITNEALEDINKLEESNTLHSRLRISQDTTKSIRNSLDAKRKETARTLKRRKTRTNPA